VTCHGWDYQGGEMGGKAEEFNAPLPAKRAGTDANAIARLLRAAPHSYDPSMLSEGALGLVARFVVEGQHDIAFHADRQTGKAKGDPLEGRPVYQGVCISCHDGDGRAYIECEPGDQSSLGWLARNRPKQVLHKIRNGQPGTDMVQLRFLNDTQITNLLAYLQTLPDP